MFGASVLLLLLAFLPVAQAQDGHVHTDRKAGKVLPLPKEDGVFHFLIFGDRTGGPPEGLKVLAQAVKDANLLDPDLVMTVGDLVPGYNPTPEWLAEMLAFREVMDGLRMRWYPVAGNHDVYWGDGEAPPGHHEREYEEHFGPLWYWFPHKNAAFLVLFTDEGDREKNEKGYDRPGLVRFSDAQLAWLEKTLEETKKYEHVFLFMHHPRWISAFYPGNNWSKAHDLCVAAGNVTAVFGGHIHRQRYEGRKDGIEYFTLATTGGGILFDVPGTGYLHHMNLVTVRKGRVSVTTLPVGAVLDPKEMTPERLAEIDRARSLPMVLSGPALPVTAAGGAGGALNYTVTNPTQHPLEITVSCTAPRGDWTIAPDHVHFVLEPAAERKVALALIRAADDYRGTFSIPRITLAVDFLGETRRVTLPERSSAVALRPEGLSIGEIPEGGNHALSVDGEGAVCVPSPSLRLPKEAFTVEAWCRPATADGVQAIVGKTESSAFTLFLQYGVPTLYVHLGEAYVIAKGAEDDAVRPGEWHHLAGVYDGKELRIYLDGRLLGKTPGTGFPTPNGLPLFVGAEPDGTGGPNFPFQGLIDEVRLSRGARYEGERFVPAARHETDDAAVLLLHLDRSTGPFVTDASANGSHGYVLGAGRWEKATPAVEAEKKD